MGASVYNQTTNQMYMFPLGTYATVFHAEVPVYAICSCAKTILVESEASIAICSDSQVALMALRASKITSSLVAETIKALTELSMFNSVRLLWIPGHSDIPGNETADQYAKQAASQNFVGLEPVLGIPTTKIRNAAQLWANAQQRKLWQTTSGCRQAKMSLYGPDKKLSRYALSLPR